MKGNVNNIIGSISEPEWPESSTSLQAHIAPLARAMLKAIRAVTIIGLRGFIPSPIVIEHSFR